VQYELMRVFVKLVGLNKEDVQKITFKVCKWLVRTLESMKLGWESKFFTNTIDEFSDLDRMMYDEMMLQIAFWFQLLKEPVYWSTLCLSLLPLTSQMTSQIDRFTILVRCFSHFVSNSIRTWDFRDESFSFKSLPWFMYLFEVLRIIKKTKNEIIWEEEVFLSLVEALCDYRHSVLLEIKKSSGGTIFDAADVKREIEVWVKLAIDIADSWMGLLDVQMTEGLDTNWLCIGFLRFMDELKLAGEEMTDSPLESFFEYKYQSLIDLVISKIPIVGLAEIKVWVNIHF
jgi:hypothetical protein